MVLKALADEAVNLASPIAQRALQAGIKAAQQGIQQFNHAGGPTLLAAAKLTVEKGFTLAGTVMQAIDTGRKSARLITDFIELSMNDPQSFMGALLHGPD